MSGLDIELIPALSDNYIYLIHEPRGGVTGVVDPAQAAPVLERLVARDLSLSWILITHHHPDHTGGNLELKERTGCRIVGPAGESAAIPGVDETLSEGDRFPFGETEAEIFETPGHTRGPITYWFAEDRALFCADTLFSLGCGRLFEGTPEQMWSSLSKLAALPDDARIYCGHEYTQSNARFALTVDPENQALRDRAEEVARLRAEGRPTIPVDLGTEKKTNPFLRPDDEGIRRQLGLESASDVEVFAEIRRRKDAF